MNKRNGFDNFNNENYLTFNHSMQNFFVKKYEPNNIAIPKDGIPFDRLFNVNENLFCELQCPLCLGLVWSPNDCSECGKIFCEYCINLSLKNSGKSCPCCKSKKAEFRLTKSLNSFFGKIKIKCINKGCKDKPEYFDYIKHLEKCSYRLYHCKNEGCKYQDTLDNIKYHSNECKHRIIKCKYCSKEIKEKNFEMHEKTECTQNVSCGKCKKTMTRGFYWSKHHSEQNENTDCLKAQVELNQKLYKKSQEDIDKLKETHTKEINKYTKDLLNLKNQNKDYKKENGKLKKTIEDFKKSLKLMYSQFFIEDNYNEDVSTRYNTEENESKYNTATYNPKSSKRE